MRAGLREAWKWIAIYDKKKGDGDGFGSTLLSFYMAFLSMLTLLNCLLL